MKISSTPPLPTASHLAGIRQTSGRVSPEITAETTSQPTSAKTLNMRSISLHEINTLIQAGVDGLLDILPAVPGALVNANAPTPAIDDKVDFIGQIEAHIAFKQSRGENVDFLNQVLSNIKHLDGMVMPASIDTQA